MKLYLDSADAMRDFGRKLARQLQIGDTVKLYGDLGAGKTTIARGILLGLGHEGEVPSPTFPIVQYYHPPDTSIPAVHADFYRIENPDELYELGLDDAGYDSVIIAEWPEHSGAILGENCLAIYIDFAAQGGREIRIEPDNNKDWANRLKWT